MTLNILNGIVVTGMGILVYVYVLYPILLWCAKHSVVRRMLHSSDYLQKLREAFNNGVQRRILKNDPQVTMIVPCYNEAGVIREKVHNFKSLTYASPKLSLIMVNDCSDDTTGEEITKHVSQNISVIHNPERLGKLKSMIKASEQAEGDIIVFSDSAAMIGHHTIDHLIGHFRDSSVGCVTGVYKKVNKFHSSRGSGEGIYWRYEMGIRKLESDLRSTTHATGALYAVRKDLFKTIVWKENIVNDDFFIPLQIIEKGFDVHSEPKAVACEYVDTDVQGEFSRRCRIAMGNFQMIPEIPQLLKVHQYFTAMQLVSHKLLRSLSGFLLPILLVVSVILSFFYGGYLYFVGAQVLFYALAGLGMIGVPNRMLQKACALPLYFTITNVASMVGFSKYLFSEQSVLWGKSDTNTLEVTYAAE
ncbi:MAG: glycosyltransferase [Fibrobacterales bacterium]